MNTLASDLRNGVLEHWLSKSITPSIQSLYTFERRVLDFSFRQLSESYFMKKLRDWFVYCASGEK